MSDSRTPPPPSPPRRQSYDSYDSDVVGFADQPYEPQPPPPQAEQPRPSPLPVRNNSIRDTTSDNDVEAARTQPPVQQTPKLEGAWRSIICGLLSVAAFTVPWMASLAFCWGALSRVPLHDAPREVVVSCILATIEVGMIFLIFLSACIGPLEIGDSKAERQSFFYTVFILCVWFLMLEPMATGIWIWDAAIAWKCGGGAQTGQCRLGKAYVIVLGVYRTFGIIFSCCGFSLLGQHLKKRWIQQQQQQRQAGN